MTGPATDYNIGLGVGAYDIDRAYYPDADVIARNVLKAFEPKAKQNVKLPTQAALTKAISGITLTNSMKQINGLQVVVNDPEWQFLDSGIWDTDENSELDPVDLNYPDGSRWWWRLSKLSPSQDSRNITLTFLDREVFPLMSLMGPIKGARAKMTRAEFLKMLCSKVHSPALIEFYSRELDVKQKIAASSSSSSSSSTAPSSQQPSGQATKSGGLGANTKGLTIAGQPLNSTQIATANTILAVGTQLKAPTVALVGAIYAAMGESDLGTNTAGAGTFQTTGDPSFPTDTASQAKAFFLGQSPFGSPGAIKLAQAGAPAWVIANQTEVNAAWGTAKWPQTGGDSYGGHLGGMQSAIAEAAKIVAAGGGGSLSGGSSSQTVIEPYYFTVGTHESYWTAMTRLAQEVNWELFWDGNRLYYDDEQTLVLQKVARVVHRDDPIVVTWSYDWDVRQIATQMSITLIGGMFDYFAGEVLQLEGFGPASTGSTASPAKRPGCWLVQDVTRNKGGFSSQLTLVQPDMPKLEPAPQVKTVTTASSGSGAGVSGITADKSVASAVAAAQKLGALNLPYSISFRTLTKTPPSGGYDCSAGVSWVLLMAGFPLPGGATWGDWAPVSGAFTGWGDAGRGAEMTIWTSSDHIFIEFNVPGVGHVGFDSGHPSPPNGLPWYGDPFYDTSYTTSGAFVARHFPGT